jgi:hypothetical protein
LDLFEGVIGMLCSGLVGFEVCNGYVAVFGGYDYFWVES